MFAKTIIDSDAFLDMPQSTQLLYFHLSMRADDDGFINNPKAIMRNVKCNEDDIKVLIAKKFIIPFESGIVVIKHWKIHNYIAKDRYKETKYKEEKATLTLDENNSYTSCTQSVYSLETQDRLGKESIGKDNNIVHPPDGTALFEYLWDLYPNKKGKKKAFEAFKRAIKKGATVEQIREGIKAYKRYIKESGIEAKYIKMGSTFFVQEAWSDDWTPTKDKPKNAFNDFKQNEYEWDELEKELLDNG